MIFTATELGVFMRCRRKALLSSKNGRHLTPLQTPLHFSVGSLIHRAHQLWLNNPNERLYTHVNFAAAELLRHTLQRYTQLTGTGPSDDELRITHDAVATAIAMCENYQVRWGTPLPDDYELLGAEQKIRVPVEGTDHFLEGRLDALIRHIPTGRVDVLERKTYNTRPKESALLTNDQFMAYRWLVWKLDLGAVPHVMYDGSWRRASVPRGRTFEDLFLRTTLTCNRAELDEFDEFLPHLLNDMAYVYQTPSAAYKNRQWQGCWDCSFNDDAITGQLGVCRAMSRGEDYEALIKLKFTERTDDVDDEDSEV